MSEISLFFNGDYSVSNQKNRLEPTLDTRHLNVCIFYKKIFTSYQLIHLLFSLVSG